VSTLQRKPVASACGQADAALTRAFSFLGKRWNAAVLASLGDGPAGFRDISRSLDGISDSVLSSRLAELTEAGLITRTVDEGPPVAVSYSLTDAGQAFMPVLREISRWAAQHLFDE
jgi:DNA-binding HxlR family transcriptional regulator